MLDILLGERYKMQKGYLSKIMILVYLFTGILYFFQCRTLILEFDITELVKDDTIGIFAFIFGDVTQYGNELKSTIIILGILAVYGLMSALFVIPIFTSIFVTDEYLTRSIQQLSGKGISRYKIVLSKFFGISGFVIVMNIFVVAIGIVTTIASMGLGNVSDFIMPLLYFEIKILLMNVALIAVCILCSFGVKNCGFAMPLCYFIIICLIGELADGLFSASIMNPIITYLVICFIFISSTIFMFNKSDL